MDEPGAFLDQLVHQFRAGDVALQADLAADIGNEAGRIGDDAGGEEIVDLFERHIAGIVAVEPVPCAVDADIEPVVQRPLGALAARGGDLERAAQEHGQLAAIAAFGLLHRGLQKLQHPADAQRDKRVQRHVERDRRQRQRGGSVDAEKFEAADFGRRLHQLHADEQQRGRHAEHAHRQADGAAGQVLDRFLHALVDIVEIGCAAGIGGDAILQMEMGVGVVEKRGVEAGVEERPPFAVQGRGKHVAHGDDAGILQDHQSDQDGGASDNSGERIERARIVEQRDRGDQFGGRLGKPDPGLARRHRQRSDEKGQRPGFLPAVRQPVGSQEPPESLHS